MALNHRAIKVALADQIRAGIERATTVRPFRAPGVTRPAIHMTFDDITYFTTMGPNGQATVTASIKVRVNAADEDSAEIAMDDYLSVGVGNTSSIADAVNADPTLGGVVESCVVLEVGTIDDDDDDLVAELPVTIMTRKAGAQA